MKIYIKIDIDVDRDSPLKCGKNCPYLEKYNPDDYYCLLFNEQIKIDESKGNRVVDCLNSGY